MESYPNLFINGEWIEGQGKKRQLINPADESIIADIFEASVSQAIQAVDVARNRFDNTDWSINKEKRVDVLLKVANLLESNAEEVARLETLNTGKPIRESRIDIEDSVTCIRYYAKQIEKELSQTLEMDDGSISSIVYEPIGVCTLILPWNFPLLLGVWKIAPALAAGNTVVFKPSELTPLSILRFTELLQEAGIPDGVFNLVLGDGQTVGQTIISHPYVDKVSFTGGVETGKIINEICARSLKQISLELGGKSPMIIFEDIDVDRVVEWILFGGFFNQGEVCVASSRILIQESMYLTILNGLKEKIKRIKIGKPFDETTEMGPIISKDHLEKVKSYLDLGVEEGATLIGGKEIGQKGFYLQPAIFVDVSQSMRIVQEEIFGPVITVQSFKDEEEAVQLANGTKYGLAAGIMSEDLERASRVASRIKAGTIWINHYHTPYVGAPWGGYKQSGIGRELGVEGLNSYRNIKHLSVHERLKNLGWYSL